MRRHYIVFFYFISILTAIGQPKMKLPSTGHDFGVFREEEGRQSFSFIVRNTGDKPLVIQNIVASCGCTTPDWTRSPIAPGTEGRINAVFDPAGRPGPFRKTLTIYSNSDPSPVILTLKGEVRGKTRTILDSYPWQLGVLKLEGNSITFPEVLNTEKRIKVMPLINPSASPVKIEFENVVPYLELKAIPAVLKPGKNGLIECIYHGNKVEKWGYVSDTVRIRLNGTVQQQSLFIQAVLKEDFSKLSKSEMTNAPVLRPLSTKTDIGTIEAGKKKEVEFTFRNEGKRDLIIRSIWGSGTCFTIRTKSNLTVPPGETGSVNAIFNTEKLSGKVSRSVYIFSNDPANSKISFLVQALVTPVKNAK